MKKILIISNMDITIYLFRKEIIKRLVDEKYRVIILCPNGEKLEYFSKIGCEIVDLKMNRHSKNLFKEILLLSEINKQVKRINPDLIMTYTIKPNIYGGIVARFRKKKIISTVTGLGTSIQRKGFITYIIKRMYRFGFKKTTKVFFQNQSNLEWYKKNILDTSSYVLTPGSGVNLEAFKFFEIEEKTKTVFLFLGRIMRDKGINEFLEAASFVKAKYQDSVEFKVAGLCEKGYEDIIKEFEDKKIIEYLDFVDDVSKEIKNADCVVLPSYHEGMSNTLLEAQATGRSVIASDVPGCINTFINGETGFAVKPRNVESLIEKIKDFINTPFEKRNEMSTNARKYVEDNFDRKKVVEMYFNIIKRVLEKGEK